MTCSHPIDATILADYWLAALPGPEEEAIEEHLLGCDECGARLREVIALAEGVRDLARAGSLRTVVRDARDAELLVDEPLSDPTIARPPSKARPFTDRSEPMPAPLWSSLRVGMIAIPAVAVILLVGTAYYGLGRLRAPAPTPTPASQATSVAQGGQASIVLFDEGQKLEQQRQFDKADEKYREAFAADKNNDEAAAAFARGESYRKAKAASLAAVKANDRVGAVRLLIDAQSIDSARFLADGLDKTMADISTRRGPSSSKPPPLPMSTPTLTSTPTPTAPQSPTDDRSAIEAVLKTLSSVLSTETNRSHDVGLVLRVWPGATVEDAFGDNESQAYSLRNLKFVALTANSATVDCDRSRLMRRRPTDKTTGASDSVRIELRKSNGVWLVQSIRERQG